MQIAVFAAFVMIEVYEIADRAVPVMDHIVVVPVAVSPPYFLAR